jgi:hypothetical protein
LPQKTLDFSKILGGNLLRPPRNRNLAALLQNAAFPDYSPSSGTLSVNSPAVNNPGSRRRKTPLNLLKLPPRDGRGRLLSPFGELEKKGTEEVVGKIAQFFTPLATTTSVPLLSRYFGPSGCFFVGNG